MSNFMSRSNKAAVVGIVATMAFSAMPMLTSVAQADPSCTVGTSGSPGRQSFTLKVSGNPCGRQVRAFATCLKESGGSYTEYGSTIKTGSSKADCGAAGYVNKYGHEVNVPGQGWTRYTH